MIRYREKKMYISASWDSNIELLRLVCCLFVITEHFCEQSALGGVAYAAQGGQFCLFAIRFLYSFARVAVNVFILILGYFMINNNERKVGKVIAIIVMTSSYGAVIYLVKAVHISHEFQLFSLVKFMIPQNYYVSLYITLFLISPFINLLVGNLSKRQYQNMLVLLLTLFGIYSTCINFVLQVSDNKDIVGVYTVSLDSTERGFSIVGFVLMYLIGGYIKLYGLDMRKDLW